jgi:hypothetical protein
VSRQTNSRGDTIFVGDPFSGMRSIIIVTYYCYVRALNERTSAGGRRGGGGGDGGAEASQPQRQGDAT